MTFQVATKEHSYISGRKIKPFEMKDANQYRGLQKLGITIGERETRQMIAGMDAIQGLITTASIATPIQFLQGWLPGFVYIITAAREIDDFLGISTVGSWEDEQIVQGVLERTGTALPYDDVTNVPLSSWNVNFETRTVVRFDQGMQVGKLEAMQSARMNVSADTAKREGAALALEIERNTIGFFGFNGGANRTYGFLNDPNLPNYVNVPAGASTSTLWSTKTFLEISRDIRTSIVALRTNSQGVINPSKLQLTLAVATDSVDWLSTTSDFGISVQDWMDRAYPGIRVVNAPQLNNANGGANVFYMYADSVPDQSTDGGRTWVQPVPTKFMVVGVQQKAKVYEEDFSNATAGALLKRPYAVVRYSGI